MRKPWFWSSRNGWYVNAPNGRGGITRVFMGRTQDEADRKWIATYGDTPQTNYSVTEVVTKFLGWAEQEKQAGTLSAKRVENLNYYLGLFRKNCGHLKAENIRPVNVFDWMGTKKKWGPTSRFNAVNCLKRCWKWAKTNGLVSVHTLAELSVPAPPAREFIVSRELHTKTVQLCGSHKFATRKSRGFRLVLIALWLTGARPSELLQVRMGQANEQRWEIKEHKRKRHRKRRAIYPSPCMQTVAKLLAFKNKGKDKLFGNAKYSDWRRSLERLRKKQGLPEEFVFYSYRHSWITAAMEAGLDVATVAELAGTSVQMISRVYGHLGKRTDFLAKAAAIPLPRP